MLGAAQMTYRGGKTTDGSRLPTSLSRFFSDHRVGCSVIFFETTAGW